MKYFTKQWDQDCQKSPFFWNKKTNSRTQRVVDEYEKYYKQLEKRLPENIKKISSNDMHDGKIVSSDFYDQDFHMAIDPISCRSSIKKIIFVNARVLKFDSYPENACWLYEEIYIHQDRYEIHILFWSKEGKLNEIIISFDDVKID
ncbi:MAG: DUF4085 domain-containing protein [Firmicutes bacterium]|nr:DUF4085 domain-containing protein [Bacillota bacterium]